MSTLPPQFIETMTAFARLPPSARAAIAITELAEAEPDFGPEWPEEHRVALLKTIKAAKECRAIQDRLREQYL